MSRWRAARLGLALLFVTSCDAPETLALSQGSEGDPTLELEVIAEDLSMHAPLGATRALVDPTGYWLLAADDLPDDGGPQLYLRRVEDGERTVDIVLGVSPDRAAEFRLAPGPNPERPFLIRDAGGSSALWQLDREDGIIASNSSLSSLPGISGSYSRRLVFFEGEPAIVAVPTSSSNRSFEVYVGELDAELDFSIAWALPFTHPCEAEGAQPEGCSGPQFSQPKIQISAATLFTDGPVATLALMREFTQELSPGDGGIDSTRDSYLTGLRLRLTENGPTAQLFVPSGAPIPHNLPGADTVDLRAMDVALGPRRDWFYAETENGSPFLDRYLYGVDALTDTTTEVKFSTANPPPRSRLGQTPFEATLIEHGADGALKFRRFAGSVVQTTEAFEAPDLSLIEPAGVGAVMFGYEDGRQELVRFSW